MIARVIGRLQPLILCKQICSFSSFDDFKNKGKGQKSPFFGKNKAKDEVKMPEAGSQKFEKQKDNPFKPRKFLQNKQKAQPKDTAFQKVKNNKQASAKQQHKSQVKSDSFINTQNQRKGEPQQRNSMFLKKGTKTQEIVIEKKEYQIANQTFKVNEQSQLKQEKQEIKIQLKYYNFYNKFAEDSLIFIEKFDKKDWSSLNKMIKDYKSQASEIEIIKNLHSLLINRNPKKYVQWVSQTNLDITLLPNVIIKKILYKLVDSNQYEATSLWLNEIKNRQLEINYQIIDNIFSVIDKNSSIGLLKSDIPIKVDITLKILDVIYRSNSKKQAKGVESNRSSDGYMPGSWFYDIWYVVKNRKVCLSEFIRVFQSLFIRHHKYLSLTESHSNGLFYDVMQQYYFGSHITTAKIHSLFVHAFEMDDYHLFLEQFRQKMLWYKIKTGNLPFPNARKLDLQLTESLKQQKYDQGVFYFLLCVYGDDMRPYKIFEKDPSLLNILKMDDRFENIINDGLFNMSRESLKSNPKPEMTQQEIGQQFLNSLKDYENSNENEESQSQGYTEQDKFVLKHKIIDVVTDQELQSKMFRGSANKEQENEQLIDNNQSIPIQQQEGQNDNERIKDQAALSSQDWQFTVQQMEFAQQFEPAKERDSDDSQNSEENEHSSQNEQQDSTSQNLKTEEKIFWSNLQYFHRGNLRRQAALENNYFRRQLYKIIINSDDPINVVKAAIKLNKPQLAWTIFKQSVMQGPIKERTMKNIDYVMKAFLRQHYKNHKDPMLHEVADSLHNFNYEYLDQDSDYNQVNFIESIYQKTENFDKLKWDAMPTGPMKYDFWESTLILDRAQELIRMDINGKLSKMLYQREHQNAEKKGVEQLYPQQMGWREELIYGLGLKVPQAQPLNEQYSLWVQFQNDEQFNQFIVAPRLDQNSPVPDVQVKGYEGLQSLEEMVAVEQNGLQNHYKEKYMPLSDLLQFKLAMKGQQNQEYIEEEGVIPQQIQETVPVQQNEIEAAKSETQNAEEKQINQEVAEQEQKVEHLSVQNTAEQINNTQVINQQIVQSVQSNSQTNQQQQLSPYKVQFGQNIFGYSERNKVKGYDFEAFYQLCQNRYKPFFEQNYETKDKQYIKYLINLEAIAEQSYISDNHTLQRKLNEAQELVKNPFTINKMLDFGLWNFDFVTVQSPYQYIQKADEFRNAFFDYKKYMGLKGPKSVPDKSKHIIDNFDQIVFSRTVTQELVEELLVQRHQLFISAEAVVKIEPKDQVQQLIQWGVLNDEPIAIYMGEKLAMLTNQRISHNLALSVSKYLSHRQQIPESRVERCKQALRIVGRINRQHIYELNKDYQHITVRKYFNRYLQKRQNQLDSTALSYMTQLQPTHKYQDTSFKLRSKISRGNLTV